MGWQWIFRRDLLVSIKIVPTSTFTSLEYFFCTWGKFGVFLGTHSGWKQSTLVWICPWKWIQNPGIMSKYSRNWLLVLKWIASMMKTYLSWILFFFSISVFFFQTLMIHRTAGEEKGPFLFLSITSNSSWAFRPLFATLHVRWLPHIFSCTASNYQTATQWHLPPHWLTIWLISDGMLFSVCWIILVTVFTAATWHKKPVDLNLYVTRKTNNMFPLQSKGKAFLSFTRDSTLRYVLKPNICVIGTAH